MQAIRAIDYIIDEPKRDRIGVGEMERHCSLVFSLLVLGIIGSAFAFTRLFDTVD